MCFILIDEIISIHLAFCSTLSSLVKSSQYIGEYWYFHARLSERSFESSMANNVRSLHDTSLASSKAFEVRSRFRIEWSLCYHGEGWIAWEPATKRLSRSRLYRIAVGLPVLLSTWVACYSILHGPLGQFRWPCIDAPLDNSEFSVRKKVSFQIARTPTRFFNELDAPTSSSSSLSLSFSLSLSLSLSPLSLLLSLSFFCLTTYLLFFFIVLWRETSSSPGAELCSLFFSWSLPLSLCLYCSCHVDFDCRPRDDSHLQRDATRQMRRWFNFLISSLRKNAKTRLKAI